MSKKKEIKSKLSELSKYLEEAGFIDKAKVLKDTMHAIDMLDNDMASDFIPHEQSNVENQGYIGGDGTGGGYSLLNVPGPRAFVSNKNLVLLADIANRLDKKGLYSEAEEIDNFLKIYAEKNKEDDEDVEGVILYYSDEDNEDLLDDMAMLAGANGRMGNSAIHNQNSGGFQGFTSSYFHGGYGDLEGPAPSPSMPGAA